MKMLQILPQISLNAGGPPVAVVGLASALKALGGEVSIYTTTALSGGSGGVAIKEMPNGVSNLDVRVFPVIGGDRLAVSWQLAKYLNQTAPAFDIIHVHSLFQFPQFAAFLASKKYKIPLVVSPRGALDPHLRTRGKVRKALVDRIWQRRMLDSAAAIHYTSDDERVLTKDLGYKAPTVVIPNGLDLARFLVSPDLERVERARMETGLLGQPVIANHGRFHSKKGLEFLIEAMVEVRLKYTNALLLLIGEGPAKYFAGLNLLVSALGLDDAVIFAGPRSGSAMIDLLHAADVWALPSYTENFGNAVLEAMALGIPTVTTDRVAIAPSASAAGACIITDQTASSFATSILDILEKPDLRNSLAHRGPEFAQTYDWKIVGKQYLDFYRQLIESRKQQ